MTTRADTAVTTQVFRIYIKATPQAIWDAITKPEWTSRYGPGGRVEFDLRPGGVYRAFTSDAMRKHGEELGFDMPDVVMDGEVLEADPPRRLVHTMRARWDPATEAEGFTRLTWEIDEVRPGVSKLTVVHELDGAPRLAAVIAGEMESEGAGGGWSEILSDIKSLLETGLPLRG
jgi:uncharacterized protein YndB with AHSA1/START domain